MENEPIIKIDAALSKPIYKQIVESISKAIASKKLKQGDIIPSVNNVAATFSIARGSIFKAYNELRTAGVIDSVPGKGYFITSTKLNYKRNIFLLLSTFNPYREVLYKSLVEHLKNEATVDVYFHHHNIGVFETLIRNHAPYYNTFIIMPEIHKQTKSILDLLDEKKLYILDSGIKEFGDKYSSVCQNYEKDIYDFLKSQIENIQKYKRTILLFSDNIRAYNIINGFEIFFEEYIMPYEVVRSMANFVCQENDLCIVIDDNDLVQLIHIANDKKWILGQNLGVISYNEAPLKAVIVDGITTITTDYKEMGRRIATMVLNDERGHIANPFKMIKRQSF